MPTIDESVVKLSLDDSQFDKASDQTIKKLDELKHSLQFEGAVEGFNEIEKAAKKTDISPLGKSVESVSLQFDALYAIADTTFRRLINGAVDSGERLIKSLTIDNIASGWEKYAQKTSAVQTIMASTATQFEDTGVQMAYVEKQLDKLNWFTDETSYSFLDMVNNIGKFTSNAIDLDTAVTSMQGISNWAAISGAGIQGASMAMYNLAQAIGLGAVTLQDWKSIELANMGTVEFKQMALEAGEAAGMLQKVGDGIYQTLEGTQVTIQTFRDSLQKKWFTSDVLMDTLDRYGQFTNLLYDFSKAADDLSATPLLRYIDEYKKGTLDMEDAMTSTRMSASELTYWLERLGAEELDLGRRALMAAQEAKTFDEAVSATVEAVGTAWMNTFEIIFGNYEEAKELWSDLAEGLYEVFVESNNMRNGILRDWKALNGREYLIEGLKILFRNLANAIAFFRETFENIFPPKTGEELRDMTIGFRDLMENLTPSETTVNAIRNVLTLIFTLLQKIGQVSSVVFFALQPIWELIGEIVGGLIGLAGDIAELLGLNLNEWLSEDKLMGLYVIIHSIAEVVANVLRVGLLGVLGVLVNIVGFAKDIFTTFQEGQGGIIGFIDAVIVNVKRLFSSIASGKGLSGIFDFLTTSFNNIIGPNGITGAIKAVGSSILTLFENVRSGNSIVNTFFNGVLTIAETVFGAIFLLIQKIFELFQVESIDSNPIVNFFKGVGDAVNDSGLLSNIAAASRTLLDFVSSMFGFVGSLDATAGNLKSVVSVISEQLSILWNWFVGELTDLTLRDVADVYLIMMIGMLISSLASLNTALHGTVTAATKTLGALTTLINTAAGSQNAVTATITALSGLAANTKYLQIGVSITMIANSIAELAKLPTDDMAAGVSAMITVVGLMVILEKSLGNTIIRSAHGRVETAASNIFKLAVSVGTLSAGISLLTWTISAGFNGPDGVTIETVSTEIGALTAAVIAIGLLMLEMVGLVKLIKMVSPGDEFAKAAAGMTAMATGILMLSAAVALLSLFDIEGIIVGASSVAILAVGLGAAVALLGKADLKNALAASVAATVMAFALIELMVPLAVLALLSTEFDLNELRENLVVLMGIVALCVSGMGVAGGNPATLLAASVAMIAFASAVTILAAAIHLFKDINWDTLAKGLTLIVVAFVGFGVISAIASATALGLIALAAVFISFSATVALLATAIKLIAQAAAEFSVITLAFVAAGEKLGDEFPAKVDYAMSQVQIVIHSFLNMLIGLTADISRTATMLIIALKNGFLMALPDLLTGLLIIGKAICDVIVAFAPDLIDAIAALILVLRDGIPKIVGAFGLFLEELLASLGVLIFDGIIGLFRMVLGMFGLSGLGKDLSNAAHNMGAVTSEEFEKGFEEGWIDPEMAYVLGYGTIEELGLGAEAAAKYGIRPEDIGKDIDQGLVDGMEKGQKDVNATAKDLGEGTVTNIADGAGTKSPSWKTDLIGQNVGNGLINGLFSKLKIIFGIGEEAGNRVIEGMKDGAGTHSDSWKAAEIADWVSSGFINTLTSNMPTLEDTGFMSMTSAFNGMMNGAEQGADKVKAYLNSFAQMVGFKIDGINSALIDMNSQKAIQAAERDDLLQEKKFSKGLTSKVTETAKKTGTTAGKTAGETFSTNFDNAVKKSTGSGSSGGKSSKAASSASEKVQTEAEKIIESYKSVLEELDYLDKKHKGEYDLWSILNIDVSETEKRAAKLEYVNKQVETQLKRTQIAEEKYTKIAKAMGASSQEARDAELDWIDQQVSLAELQNEVVEIQGEVIEEAAKQLELQEKHAQLTYDLWVSNNKNASESEKLEKQLAYTLEKLEYSANRVTKATKDYNEVLEKYGEEAIETKEALNELLEAQKDYADISQEATEYQEKIVELGTETAKMMLENQTLQYELWTSMHRAASETDKYAQQEAELNRQLQAHLEERNRTGLAYNELFNKGLQDTKEGQEAFKAWLEAQMAVMEDEDKLLNYQMQKLEDAASKISDAASEREAMNNLWEAVNENATKSMRYAHEEADIAAQIKEAYEEFSVLQQELTLTMQSYAKNSSEVAEAERKITEQLTKIQQLYNKRKDIQLTMLQDAQADLEFERKRLTISDEIWKVINDTVSEEELHAHNLEKVQYELVLGQKELNNLAEQYNYLVARYGKTSDQARSAWESYYNKYKELLQLQKEMKEVQNEIVENEEALYEIMKARSDKEYALWEALNQDATDSEKRARKLTYQMQSLEYATDKLRNASAKYNTALKKYGEDAKETQQLFNDMLDAQIEYAETYNELKSLQVDIIEKNNEILEQLQYSESLIDYGYNMWEKMTKDISDAQKIEAQINKLGQQLTLQVQRANYYGAEWKKAVAKYGENSSEAQEAYLAYLEALYKAVDLQSSLADKETELTDIRAENAKKLQEAWDEVKMTDLVDGQSIYEELLEMGLSEAEIEAYVKEKAGIIEDNINAEMDFSINHMQSRAEDSLREWGMTWMDGVYDVAEDVSSTASDSMDEMTRIIAEGAELASEEMEEGVEEIVNILEEGADSAESAMTEGAETIEQTIDEAIVGIATSIKEGTTTATAAMVDLCQEVCSVGTTQFADGYKNIGWYMSVGIENGIQTGRSLVVNAMVRMVEEAILAARRAAEIRSPSRVTMWMGAMLDAGFVKGIEAQAGTIARAMSSAVQNGINAMAKVVHTDNTLDFASRLISNGITGGFQDYSYNIIGIGQSILDTLADEYDDMVDEISGDNKWLLDALREYGFDETTHGIEFVVNLDATDAKTQLEELFNKREEDLEYYDELLEMQERNREKDQSDLAVRAEANAIQKELDRILASIESYEKSIEDFVNGGRASSYEDSIAGKKIQYVQNIYSTKPLSPLDIYRNTNSQLLRFTAWR